MDHDRKYELVAGDFYLMRVRHQSFAEQLGRYITGDGGMACGLAALSACASEIKLRDDWE